MLGLWAWALGWFVVRALMHRENQAQTARFIEQSLPELRNDFINSVLLARDKDQISPDLVAQAIHEAASRSSNIDVACSVSLRRTRTWSIVAAAALLALCLCYVLMPNVMRRGASAIFTPTQYLAKVGSVNITGVSPGDAKFFVGEQVKVVATVDNPDGRELQGRLIIEGQAPVPLFGDEESKVFTFIDQARKDINYAVEIGDSRWPLDKTYYSITVMKKVALDKLELVLQYPTYTGLKTQTSEGKGDIEALVGTKVTIRVQMNDQVPSAWLDVKGKAPIRMTSADGRTFEQTLTVSENGLYRVELRDNRNEALQFVPADGSGSDDYFTIKALADKPPFIEFITPTSNVTVAPGGTLDTRLRVTDDFRISDVKFYAGKEDPSAAPTTAPAPGQDGARAVADLDFSKVKGKDKGVVPYTIKVPKDLPEGSVMEFYASVTDNKPLMPQTSLSFKFRLTVQDPTKLAAEKAKRYEELRKRLFALLEMQEHERVNTAVAMKSADLKAILDKGKEIQAGQGKIRQEMIDLVEHFPFDVEMVMVQQALAGLAQTEAVLAIDQAKVLTGLAKVQECDEAGQLLGGTQNRIINTLQSLLAIMPTLTKEKTADTATKPAGDLPQDVKEKLADLRKDLQKFIDAQNKIIKDSAPLMKKDLDKFTPDDLALMEKLKAEQDKWDKFISEKFSDFSKLAQQDFSNPVVMKELISVKSDVTMARDALKQKAVEVATALEDNGIENAKSLTSNLEKWLPDTPDRAKWSMEDPVDGQTNAEQPELPKELEDLVGDLLEDEKDLFDEMEDQTSKYNGSGDKGIGWDAMDGPISNMNAQGVTGNQLPNKDELSGRSGEGRTGKSSGEMVEDKAVGKGGRRTPTRLGAEPFQKGEIKDTSPEATGGATGGGKISGAGGEGLEGPIPPPLAKELGRLAGKQATLINKAERLQTKFAQADYSNFKFLQAITLMNKVHDDLANNRYQNALRAREAVADNLKQAKLLLTGGVDVKTDKSAAMPKYVQQEINAASNRNLPEEYKDALQEYYRKLGAQTSEGK